MNTQSKDLSDLREEIGRLRGQIESTVSDITRSGKRQLRRARSGAADGLDVMSRRGGEIVDEVGHELQVVEERAVGAVRAHPLEAVALAIGFGFLLAIVLRR